LKTCEQQSTLEPLSSLRYGRSSSPTHR